jgi:hypothetical protein
MTFMQRRYHRIKLTLAKLPPHYNKVRPYKLIVLTYIELNGTAWYPNQRLIITGQATILTYIAVLLQTRKYYHILNIYSHYFGLRDFNWYQPILICMVQYIQVINAPY